MWVVERGVVRNSRYVHCGQGPSRNNPSTARVARAKAEGEEVLAYIAGNNLKKSCTVFNSGPSCKFFRAERMDSRSNESPVGTKSCASSCRTESGMDPFKWACNSALSSDLRNDISAAVSDWKAEAEGPEICG